MAMFKKNPDSPAAPAARESRPPSRATSSDGAISIVGPGMRIVGDVITDGSVRVEGRVEGTVRAGQSVVLSRDGEVNGEILAQDAVIGGRVSGVITADGRLEIQGTGIVDGEIRTRAEHLKMDEGARFNGQIRMLDDSQPVAAIPAETGVTVPEE